jgi:hypothetical protein
LAATAADHGGSCSKKSSFHCKFNQAPLRPRDERSTKNDTRHLIMGKRTADDIEDGSQAYLKRQKIGNVVEKAGSVIEIHSGKQLRQLLAFDQDPARSKNGKPF